MKQDERHITIVFDLVYLRIKSFQSLQGRSPPQGGYNPAR